MDRFVKHREQAVARARDRDHHPDCRAGIGKEQERKQEEDEHSERDVGKAQQVVHRVVDRDRPNDTVVHLLLIDRHSQSLLLHK